MTEKQLHTLWRLKRFPLHLLQLTTGEKLELIAIGTYNLAAGPDFFNGAIRINNIIHHGNIEFHLKSSDWYVHGHQEDQAYDNVILHIVWKHDKEILVKDKLLPTIELSPFLTEQEVQRLLYQNTESELPCVNMIHAVPAPIIWNQIEDSAYKRLIEKAKAIPLNIQFDTRKILLHFCASAFGRNTNAASMEILVNSLPFKIFSNEQKSDVSDMFSYLAFDLENAQNEPYLVKKYCLTKNANLEWKRSGQRPNASPNKLLTQFVHFISEMDWELDFWNLPTNELSEYLLKLFKSLTKFNLTKNTFDLILINGFVPFLVHLGITAHDENYIEKAFEILQSIKAEDNRITEFWRKADLHAKNAFESQGLLAQNKLLCSQKRCANCKIGRFIFDKNA